MKTVSGFYHDKKLDNSQIIKSQQIPMETTKNFNPENSKQNTKQKKSEQSFLERNYFPSVLKSENIRKEKTEKMLSKQQVNSWYFMMKKYYNDLTNENKRVFDKNFFLKTQNKTLEHQIEEFKQSRNINVSANENISIFGASENIITIRSRIIRWQNTHQEAKTRFTNENEYEATCSHMLENETDNLSRINEEIVNIEQKIKEIQKTSKIWHDNQQSQIKVRNKTNIWYASIQKEMSKYDELIYEQEWKKQQMMSETERQEEKIISLKENIREIKEQNKARFILFKKETLDKIDEYNYEKAQKEQTENDYVNFILGLNYFQRNIIDKSKGGEEINAEEIRKNDEYKMFRKNLNYKIIENKEEFREDNTLTLDELKEKFDEITVTTEEVVDYYNKMQSLVNFTRKKMTELNDKYITWKTKKKEYKRKVNEIISKDYKNFNDLLKGNQRFLNFLEKYKNNTNAAEKWREYKTRLIIEEQLTENEQHPDSNEQIKISKPIFFKLNKMQINIEYSIEAIINSIREGHYLKGYDSYINTNDSNTNNDKICKVYSDFKDWTTTIFLKYKLKSDREYLHSLLTYAKEIQIENADFILKTLFNPDIKRDILSLFLKQKWTTCSFMFYYMTNVPQFISMHKWIENIWHFYQQNNTSDQSALSQNYSKIISIEPTAIQPQKQLMILTNQNNTTASTQEYHPVTTKNIKANNSSIKFSKKTTHEIWKTYSNLHKKQSIINSWSNYNDFETATYQTKNENSAEKEIQNEYNYEYFDDNKYQQKMSVDARPKTSRITFNAKIAKNWYEPSLKKSEYLRELNKGLGRIKYDTTSSKNDEIKFKRNWKDIDELRKEFFIYNNPRIKVNSLSDKSYRFIAEKMIKISRGEEKTRKDSFFSVLYEK